MGRPQSAWAKFRVLMWKNWTLQRRHKVQAVLEVLLPVLFTSLIVITRVPDSTQSRDGTDSHGPILYEPVTVDRLPSNR